MSTDPWGRAKSQAVRLMRGPLELPLGAPKWPSSVPRPKVPSKLGVNYDSDWARKYSVRLARAAWTDIVTRPLVTAVARPAVNGLDRLEGVSGPVIFAPNHSSHLDTPLMLAALPERFRHRLVTVAAADYFFDNRAKAIYFSFSLNAVPIERERTNRMSVDRAQALIAQGWNLLIFPEQGRSPDGWAQPHRAGAAWLASRSGRPIVPVHIEGTHKLWPRGANRLYTGETRVTFGRPLPADIPPRQLVGQVEEAIAALADEASTDWWSARRRQAEGRTPALTGPPASAWRRAWALGPSPKDSARKKSPAAGKQWPKPFKGT